MDSLLEEEDDWQISNSQASTMSPPQSATNDELASTHPIAVISDQGEEQESDNTQRMSDSSEEETLLATVKVLEENEKQAGKRRMPLHKRPREQSGIGSDAAGRSSAGTETTISSCIYPYLPPDWKKQYDVTITSQTEAWKLFPVAETTSEFKVVADLIAPLTPVTMHKIVNPEVWNLYQGQRANMLKKHMEKYADLIALGMEETEAKARVERQKNFTKNPFFTSQEGKYSLNEALLLYCNNWLQSGNDIIAHGIDDRLSTFGRPNHFGKGMYFVDDPMHTNSYSYDRKIIMIFAVLLGDCRDFENHGHEAVALKREPEKKLLEKRNLDDTFFDSITARDTTTPSQNNEYVIFNRNQCYPLYKVEYRGFRQTHSKSAKALALDPKIPECFATARQTSPNISWKERRGSTNEPQCHQIFMPNQHQTPTWPFLAQDLFKKMGVSDCSSPSLNFRRLPSVIPVQSPRPSKKRKQPTSTMTTAISQNLPLRLECPECFEHILVTQSTWKNVKCQHNLCAPCFAIFKKIGTSMRGVTHTSFRCPTCNQIDGIEIGDFPYGVVMRQNTIQTSCEGYPDNQTITMNYKFDNEAGSNTMTAFLPDNAIGQKIALLLLVACDRRLIFKAGPNNSVIWNIPHKTSQKGGLLSQGYPDPDYLVRVRKELRSFGII